MTLNIGNIVGDKKDLDLTRQIRTYLSDITHVFPSEDNPYECNAEDTEILAANIAENGLYTPLTVETLGTDMIVISGHRRLAALNWLVDHNVSYRYCDADITGSVPVVIRKTVTDTNKRMLSMIAANNQRDMTTEEKKKVIDTTMQTLENMKQAGTWSKPAGKRTAECVAELTGIKEHFIKDYLAQINRSKADTGDCVDNPDNASEKTHNDDVKSVKAMLKALKTANKVMLNPGDAAYVGMDSAMKMEIANEALILYTKLDRILQ